MKYKLKLLSLNARLSHASLFIVLKSGYFRKLEKLRLPRQTMVAKYSHLISFLQRPIINKTATGEGLGYQQSSVCFFSVLPPCKQPIPQQHGCVLEWARTRLVHASSCKSDDTKLVYMTMGFPSSVPHQDLIIKVGSARGKYRSEKQGRKLGRQWGYSERRLGFSERTTQGKRN